MNVMHIGFLAAGAVAMTLPLWIHLLLRQRATSLDIGSIRFVKQVVRRTRSRQRIQRWLLLALRALAVLLLGLLFARPFLPDTPADGSTREVAILIDRSASMSALGADGTSAFETAVSRVQEYLRTQGEQTRVHVGLFDATGVAAVPLKELEHAKVASTATGFRAAFDWATDVLSASDRVDRSLFVLSDLQRLGVSMTDLSAFPTGISVRIEDPAPAIAQNIAIESALAVQVELRPGVPVAAEVQVVNHGAFPAVDVAFELRLEGPQQPIVVEQSLSLTADERKTIRIELPIQSPGFYRGQVSLASEDPFVWDNRRSIAFEVRHPDRLLLIDGDAGNQSWESETYFVETALRLRTAVGEGPARTFEVERLVWDRGSGFPDLTGYRLIVMANPGRFTETDASRLKAFVEAGGNVLWFPGERSTNSVYDRLVEQGLLGAATIGPATDTLARVNVFDRSHPALKPLADPQHGDLRSLTASRVIPIKSIDPDSEVLVRSRRWPLVISHQTGKGRFVLVATSADRSWNDWPQNRLFVPLIRQLAAWLTGQLEHRQGVQTEIIDRPDHAPGITVVDDSLVVRNVAPGESQIGRFGTDQFREAVSLSEKSLNSVESDRRERLTPAGVSRSDEKWPLVVWGLLGILGCELVLASRVHE